MLSTSGTADFMKSSQMNETEFKKSEKIAALGKIMNAVQLIMGCGWQAVFILCDDKMKVIDSVATSAECRSVITMIQEEYLADSASVEVEHICGSGSSSLAKRH